MPTYEREVEVAIEASVKAAEAIRARYGAGHDVRYKTPIEPVTEADLVANGILHTDLLAAFPTDGWLSEESQDDGSRLEKERVWIVDPLDGTREFIAGRPEFTVSVALCAGGKPVVGVIVNPITEHVWSASKGAGARRDGKPIHVRDVPQLNHATVLVSRSETRRGLLECYEGIIPMIPCGGAANKLVRIADGRADGTFTTENRCEWDVAAGVLILQEAGGKVSRLDRTPFRFNREAVKFAGIVASNGPLHGELLEAVNAR